MRTDLQEINGLRQRLEKQMREELLRTLFWTSSGLVAYVYAGYPLAAGCLAWLRTVSAPAEPTLCAPLPSVSLIISAFNEDAVIADKLLNSLALDYPPDLLEIIVVSDASTDRTDEIVTDFASPRIRLVRQHTRLGKSAGINAGMSLAGGHVVVFSDANAIFERDALAKLLKHFRNPGVGYVVGSARYRNRSGQPASADSEGLYWRLETWLKQKESCFASVVGGDGAIYAIRRDLFTQLRPTDINDLLNPLQIIAKGYRGVYEPEAICYEDAGDSFRKEFRRKVRIVSRSIGAVVREPRVLLPWCQFPHWFCLVSHKLLRWFAPLFLAAVLGSSVMLWQTPLYRAATIVQLTFYGIAALAAVLGPRRVASRILYLPYYFCLVNLASVAGIVKFVRGSLSPTWETVRHGESAREASPPAR